MCCEGERQSPPFKGNKKKDGSNEPMRSKKSRRSKRHGSFEEDSFEYDIDREDYEN